jgi:hypothetical protein
LYAMASATSACLVLRIFFRMSDMGYRFGYFCATS